MAPTPLAFGLATLALLAACGARTDTVPECNSAAVNYCDANGCPQTGPSVGTAAGLDAWCAAWPAYAPRVTGIGTCNTPSTKDWAIDVETADPTGGTLYLLYDPTSGDLVEVSNLLPGTVGATNEVDYGSCGAGIWAKSRASPP